MTTMYVDESGATGNNVDDDSQPYFTIAAICVSPTRASELVAEIRKRTRTGPELKAKNLLKTTTGKRALSWLLDQITDEALIHGYCKNFLPYLKLYDYLIDPVDCRVFGNTLEHNAHRRTAHELYLDAHRCIPTALNLRTATVQSLGHGCHTNLEFLATFPPKSTKTFSSLVHSFLFRHSAVIMTEYRAARLQGPSGDWLLEMSLPAIQWSAAYWSKRHSSLRVIADESRPIAKQRELLTAVLKAGRPGSLTDDPDYHWPPSVLSFSTVRSEDSAGVQIADLVAGAARAALHTGDVQSLRPMFAKRTSVLPLNHTFAPGGTVATKSQVVNLLERYL